MKVPLTATGEDGRLAALEEYDLLAAPTEEIFHALALFASSRVGL